MKSPPRGLPAKSKKTAAAPRFDPKDFPGFSPQDLRDFKSYYVSQLKQHQTAEKRVGWNSAQGQSIRFEIFYGLGPLQGAKILDVGCGLGAFWAYLRGRGVTPRYTGVDLFPNVIREARRNYPEPRFEVRNILSRPFPARAFDYVFLSGVFNVKIRDNWEYMRALLVSSLRQARKAVAFNVLNAEAELKEADRFAVEPKALVSFARKLGASKVHLFDHYHHLDLTLFLHKKK